MHDIADQPIPGCHIHGAAADENHLGPRTYFDRDERGTDPCEPAHTAIPYANAITVLDVVDDRDWLQCLCVDATPWALPDHDCDLCLGTGAIVAVDRNTGETLHCDTCAGREYDNGFVDDDRADCINCLGTGHRFQVDRPTYATYADYRHAKAQREAEEAKLAAHRAATEATVEYYYAVAEAEGMLPPVDFDPAPARWQMRIITLESAERRPCGHCNDGWEKYNDSLRRCNTCTGTGSLPVATGRWLCQVDINSAYYQHTSGRLASDRSIPGTQGDLLPGWTLRYGKHSPSHLPTERHVPFHRNDAVTTRPRRPHLIGGKRSSVPARPWRTSDGVQHPVTQHWRDDDYEY